MTTIEALAGARELVADTGITPLKALHLFVPDSHPASWLLWDAAEQVVTVWGPKVLRGEICREVELMAFDRAIAMAQSTEVLCPAS